METIFFRQIALASFFALVTILYFHCDDAGVTVDEDYCITGQISNWTSGEKTLHAYLRDASGPSYSYASCTIDAQGKFSLCLKASVSDTTLYPADSVFYSGCTGGNVTFDPPYARGTEISSFKVKSGDTTIGIIKRNNYDTLYNGAFSVTYIYANKNVVVSGYKICTGDTLKFDGTAVAGWTKVVKTCTNKYSNGETYQYSTNEPPGAIWKYVEY